MKYILIPCCDLCPHKKVHTAINKDNYHKPYCALTFYDILDVSEIHGYCPLADYPTNLCKNPIGV